MNGVLSASLLTDSFVTSDALEPLLKSLNAYRGASAAANALARRGLTERLSELGMDLAPENQVAVLAALASGGVSREQTGLDGWSGVRRPEPKTKEETFWRKVVSTQPLQASWALAVAAPYGRGPDVYGPIVTDEIRAFWHEQAEASNVAKKDFELPEPAYLYRLSVEYLAKARREEDAPLFQSLLQYRGYELEQGYTGAGGMIPYQKRHFRVRQEALEALKSLGKSVPEHVVLEK
jgi:hypothetical protein